MAVRHFNIGETVLLNIRNKAVKELFLNVNEQQKLGQMLLVGEIISIRYFNGAAIPFYTIRWTDGTVSVGVTASMLVRPLFDARGYF